MKKFIFFTLAIILSLSIVLMGCGKSEVAKPAGGKEGGILYLAGSGNVANMGDPNVISNPGDAGLTWVAVEPLLILGPDGSLKPWLAERFEIAEDGSYMMLYLRQGVKFHDGTDFNAAAAKVNLDNGINSTVWPNMKACESAEIIDDYTVKLNFKGGKFDWYAAKSLTGFFSCLMFSPKFLSDNTEEYKRTHVVGTGPFIFSEFSRDQYIKFVRNDNYWRGKPYLDAVQFNIIPDPTTQLLAFKAGEIYTLGVQPKDAADLKASGYELRETYDVVFNMCFIPSSGNPDSILSNLKVRQAFEHAIDKQALVDGLTYGYGHTTNQIFIETLKEYDPNVVGYDYDIQEAKTLLTEAGYPDGIHTQIYMADFLPTDLPLAVQDMVKEAGITVDLVTVSMVQMNEMVASGGAGWDGYMWSIGIIGVTYDPSMTFGNGPLNGTTTWASCYEPPELLELSAQASSETDSDKRAALYREISGRMTDEFCMWTFMYWSPGLSTISPKLKGATIGEYKEFYAFSFAWIEE